MYAKLKKDLLKVPYFNWITLTPLFLAFIIPSILEPEWLWRLFLILLSSLGLALFTLRVILIPDLLKKEFVRGNAKTKQIVFVIGYIAIATLFAVTSYFTYKAAIDLFGYQNLKTEKVLIEATTTGGVAVLAGQTLYFNNQSHTLAYYWGVITPQKEYTVTYSPTTNFIYEIY